MAINPTPKYSKAWWDQLGVSFNITFYIKDKNDELVDFSDRVSKNGLNLLAKVGSISLVSEKREGTGATSSQATSVELFNEDQFFRKPFPSTLKTVGGASASFSSTKNGKRGTFYGQEAILRVRVQYSNSRTEEGDFSHFICGKISGSRNSPTVSLELKDKSLSLRRESSAERVKNGLDWWSNVPIRFALEELLKQKYIDDTGGLPTSFIIPDKIEIQSAAAIAGESGDQRVLSHYGKVPERDSSGNWLNRSLIPRALLFSVAPSQLSSSTSPAPNPFAATDTLYFGLDDELWYRDLDTEIDYLIDDSTLGAGWNIRELFYSSHQRKVYGIAFQIESDTITSGSDYVGSDVKVFKYDGTTFSIITTLSNVFMSHFCYRRGRAAAHGSNPPFFATYVGQRQNDSSGGGSGAADQDAGENIVLPFRQRVVAMAPAATESDRLYARESVSDDVFTEFSGSLPSVFDPGYYHGLGISISNPSTEVFMRFSLGQKGFFVFNSRSTTDIYLWYAEAISATQNAIHRINLRSGIIEDNMVANYIIYGIPIDPLCGCADTDSSDIIIGGISWDDTSGFTFSKGVVHRIAANGSITEIYDPSSYASETQYFTPLEMLKNSGDSNILILGFFRDRLNQNDAYCVATLPESSASNISIKQTFAKPLRGLAKSGGTSYYAFEIGTSRMVEITSTGVITVKNLGYQAVEGESGLAAGLVTNNQSETNSEIVYGISSPVPLLREAYDNIPSGLNYLFKLDTFYSGRIPLLKNSRKSNWAVIELLGQLSNHKPGLTRGGDFYFLPITDFGDEEDDLIVEIGASNRNLIDVAFDSGEDEVYNLVRIFPYSVFLTEPEWEMRLVARPETEKEFDADIFVSQLDNRRKTIQLQFVSGGLISDGKVTFRWRSVDLRFETRLKAAVAAGAVTAQIDSGIDSVARGDTVHLFTDGADEIATVLRAPTAAEKESGTITFESELANSYPINSAVEVTNNLSEWSDSNGNLVPDPFFQRWSSDDLVDWSESSIDAAKDSTAGNFLYGAFTAKLTLSSGTDGYIYVDIPASEFKAETNYTILAHLKSSSTDASYKSTIELKIDVSESGGVIDASGSVESTAEIWERKELTFTTKTSPTGFLRVEIHVKRDDTTYPAAGWVDGVTLVKGNAGKLDLVAVANDQDITIGNTNVKVRFEPQRDNAGDIKEETKIYPGDQLYILCAGLDLKKEDNSVQSFIDSTSRAIYNQDLPYPDIENHYATPSLTRDIGKRILNQFAFPFSKLMLRVPFNPSIDFVNSDRTKLATIKIRDTKLFPVTFEERCRIVGIRDNQDTGITEISLRPIEKD